MGRFWCILGGRGRQGSKGMAVKAVGIGPEHHRALAADCQSSLRLEIAWQEEEEMIEDQPVDWDPRNHSNSPHND